MNINLSQALALALQTVPVVQGVDANHDGKVSPGEITAAVLAELQLVAVAVPALADRLHSSPEKLQAAAAKFAEGVQILVG